MTERAALWLAVGLTAGLCAFSFTLVVHEQQHQNDALRSILCFAEHTVKVRPGIPHKQRVAAIRFYQHAIERAHLPACD